jgi:NAD(P)H-hydrate epimerase
MCIDIEKNLEMGKYDAVTFGPGLVNEISARRLKLKRFMTEYNVPLIMDAEALKMTAENNDFEILKKRNGNTVLTPHEGEMAKLLGVDYKDVRSNREAAAIQLQKMSGAVVVLKGSKTLVASGSMMHVNTSGNPGMATGGSGDILTGMIASLAAQGMNVCDAAVCAVYLHGRAGDIAAQKKGMISMNAMDLIEEIPAAFCETV